MNKFIPGFATACAVIAFILAVGSCSPSPNSDAVGYGVGIWHDDINEVTCYLYFQKAISCIPDWQLERSE